MITLDLGTANPGALIDMQAVTAVAALARVRAAYPPVQRAVFEFNDVLVEVWPDDTASSVASRWRERFRGVADDYEPRSGTGDYIPKHRANT